MRNKTCFDCQYMGYSQATPGWEGEIYCTKSHWNYDAFNDGKDELKTKLYKALKCKDFKEEEEE